MFLSCMCRLPLSMGRVRGVEGSSSKSVLAAEGAASVLGPHFLICGVGMLSNAVPKVPVAKSKSSVPVAISVNLCESPRREAEISTGGPEELSTCRLRVCSWGP